MLERQLARRILHPISTSMAGMIEYPDLEENVAKLDDLFDKRTLLIIATNHSSHSDILVAIELVRAIRSRFPQISNFYIPVAASLVEGRQGYIAQLFYSEGTVPLLNQHNIKPLALVTENDRNKRNLSPRISEYRRLHLAVMEENSAFVDLAEGSVESGRYDCLGNVRGIQEVTNPFLPYVIQKAHETKKKVVVLPVGISGTTRILSAENIFFTWETMGAFARDWILRHPAILARATVGSPYEFPYEIEMKRNPQAVNETVMQSIASLMPPKLRGYYYPPSRAYQEVMRSFESQLERDERRLIDYGLIFPNELRQLAIQYARIK